jgi:parvulin-like peptidyl-prolyl isomerase
MQAAVYSTPRGGTQVNDTPRKPRYAALETTEPVSKRTLVSRVVLGVVAVALLAGMIVQFTPNLGGGIGGSQNNGKTIMQVNGLPVTERELERNRQGSQLFSLGLEGIIGQDLQNQLLSQTVLFKAAEADSRSVRLGANEVADFIKQFRANNGLAKDADYQNAIRSQGYTDASFRETVTLQQKIQARLKEIQEAQKITEAELKLFWELNKTNYKNEERVTARQIVVNDQKTADEVQAKLKAGEDFIKLVREYSKDESTKAEDGAIGSEKGKKTPVPVVALALPTNVATAAFALKTGGVTAPIAEAGKFYFVKVEKFSPAGQQTFEEAKAKLEEDAKQLKSNGATEAWIKALEKNAKIEITKDGQTQNIEYFNPTVAKVGTEEIKLNQLNRLVYLQNQQIQQFIQQGGAEQSAQLVEQFFKPQTLDTLVQGVVGVQAAKKLGQPFFGSDQDVVNQAKQWKTKDLTVTDADVTKYYQDNVALYSTPASANIFEATFASIEAAKAFRSAFVSQGGGDFTKSAAKQQGTVSELGALTPDSIAPEYKTVVFEAKALTKAGAFEVSDVIQKDKKFIILGATSFVEKKVKPLREVFEDAKEKALTSKRSTEGQNWLTAAVKAAKVENLYEGVRKQLEAKAAEAAKRKAEDEAKRKAEDDKRKADEAAKNPPLEIKLVGATEAKVTLLEGTTTLQTVNATASRAALNKIPNGFYTLKVEATGFKPFQKEIRFPDEKSIEVKLEK